MLGDRHKNKYLVYQVGSCEMGSEGASSRYYFCVAEGNNKDDIIENWCDNVEKLYGVRPNPKYDDKTDRYYDYYPIYMNRLINNYGCAEAGTLSIIDKYRKHDPTFEHIEERYDAE